MTTEILDLSIETLMRACKGNVKNLPSFMVHDNAVWPQERRVQLDSKNRIHLRRATFLAAVSSKLPVRAGIWHRIDCQEFHLDLQPHHLQGSSDAQATQDHKHSRVIVKADEFGRTQEDEGYGETVSKSPRLTRSDVDAAISEAGGALRGVGSQLFDRGSDTDQ